MTALLDILRSIVYGIIQGITEWLPVSSTGHLLLLRQFLDFSGDAAGDEFFNMFMVVIQLGSILAVIVLFFNKLNPLSRKKTPRQQADTLRLWGKVLAASLPAAVIGLLFEDVIDDKLSQWYVIAVTLIVYGVFFILLESSRRQPRFEQFSDISYKTALLIGGFQVLAFIPGTSRSGATISGAVLLGCSRYIAEEFSFFMAIPVMAGASGLKIIKYLLDGNELFGQNLAILLTGFVVAFLVSVAVIRFFMNFIKKHSFKGFGYYRIALGALVILYFTVSAL